MNLKIKINSIFLILLFFTNIGISSTNFFLTKNIGNSLHTNLLMSNSDVIIDKVYTFTVEQPTLFFNNCIWLEKGYFYNLSIGVVTPHTCTMVFSFWDPQNTRYDLTFSNLRQVYNISQYSKDQFLAAFNGTYILQFKAITDENLNIHIKLEKGFEIPPEPQIHIHKEKFNETLYTDYYYKIEFIRASGSTNTSGMIWMDHHVLDPNNVTFYIYNYEVLGDEGLDYMFGTATEGLYIFNMTYYSEAENIMVVNFIYEINNISDVITPYCFIYLPPAPSDDDANSATHSGILVSIPPEFMIGTLIFFGCVVGIPILIIVIRKRKNSI